MVWEAGTVTNRPTRLHQMTVVIHTLSSAYLRLTTEILSVRIKRHVLLLMRQFCNNADAQIEILFAIVPYKLKENIEGDYQFCRSHS